MIDEHNTASHDATARQRQARFADRTFSVLVRLRRGTDDRLIEALERIKAPGESDYAAIKRAVSVGLLTLSGEVVADE